MIRRCHVLLAAFAFVATAGYAEAQGASIAVGAAVPSGDLATTNSAGYALQLQILTEPMLGPLPLRIDIGYDNFAGKAGGPSAAMSSSAVSVAGKFGDTFYWIAGPGYYQSSVTTAISGHTAKVQNSYLGAQAAVGVNIPVFRINTFLEAGAVKLFSGASTLVYFPLRFGVRL